MSRLVPAWNWSHRLEFLSAFIFPLVLIAVVVGGVTLLRRNRNGGPDLGIGSARRSFIYIITFIAFVATGSGLSFLLNALIQSFIDGGTIQSGSGQVSFGVAATLVGAPTWLIFWRIGNSSVNHYPTEAGSVGRKAYVYLTLAISAAVLLGTTISILSNIQANEIDAFNVLGQLVIWGAIWLFHWRHESLEGQPSPEARTIRRLYIYGFAMAGLVALGFGAGRVLAHVLTILYDVLVPDPATIGASDGWNEAVRQSIAWAVVGAGYLWFHWHKAAFNDHASTLRLTVAYLIPILGGLITTVASSGAIFGAVLYWLIANPKPNLGEHLDFLPAAIASAAIALVAWQYHRRVVVTESGSLSDGGQEAVRAYRYLAAAVGLFTTSIGIALIVGITILIGLSSTGQEIGFGNRPAGPVSVAITLLLVGGITWSRYWSHIQTASLAEGLLEKPSPSRRIYLLALFGVAIVIGLATSSGLLFALIKALIDRDLSLEYFNAGSWGIGILLSASLVSLYHWRILKRENQTFQTTQASKTDFPKLTSATLAIAPGSVELVSQIREALNVPVHLWQRTDGASVPQFSDAQIQSLSAQAFNSHSSHVLILVNSDGFQVIGVTP